MSSAFRSLLIKEWSERRRIAGWCLALFLIYLGFCVAYELEFQNRVLASSFYTTCLMFNWLGAVLLAMTTVTGEYTQRTLRFSSSLPVSLQQLAWARLIGAWMTLVTPILTGALIVHLLLASGLFEQAGLRPLDYIGIRLTDRPSISQWDAIQFLWTLTAIALATALYQTTLISLISSWCRKEGTVGLLGALVAMFLFPLGTIRNDFEKSGQYWCADWVGAVVPANLAFTWSYGEWDGSSYQDIELAPSILWPIIINLLITLVLAVLFTYRYGRRVNFSQDAAKASRRRWTLPFPSLLSRLRFSGSSQRTALYWLNARQSIPLCIIGLAVACLLTLFEINSEEIHTGTAAEFAGELPMNTCFIGILWAVVIAIAVFAAELYGGLEQFWRSRPIAPVSWFWTKYFGGLTALLVTLDGIPGLISSCSKFRPQSGGFGWPYLACMPLLHAMIYSLTVLLICRFRKSIPVAIAAISLFYMFDQFLESIPVYPRLSTIKVFNKLEQKSRDQKTLDLTSEGYPLVYGTVLIVIVGSTLLARRVAIPAAFVRASGLVLIVVLGLSTNYSQADDATAIDELVTELQERNQILKQTHLKLNHRLHRLPEFYELAATEEQKSLRRHQTPSAKLPVEVRKSFEYYSQGDSCAWTEFDETGKVISKTSFDGTTQRTLFVKPGRDQSGGTITPKSPRPVTPFILADTNDRLSGFGLDNSLQFPPTPTISESTIDDERLTHVDWKSTMSASELNESNPSFMQQYHVTFNRSRNDWPVHLQYDTCQKEGPTAVSRRVVTMHGWIVSGSISYPKQILIESFVAMKDEPAKFVPTIRQEYNTEIFEFDPQIPAETFTLAYPAGVEVFNYDEKKYFQAGKTGELEEYRPQPRGLRGAVLIYYLIGIAAAVGYFWRIPRNDSFPAVN